MEIFQPEDIKHNAVWAAMGYLWIVSLIVLLAKKDSPFAQAHARQGFVLFVVSLVLSFIPVIGWILNIVVLVLAFKAFVNAARGKFWEVPIVSEIAEKVNF